MRRVMNAFTMPAIHDLLAESQQRLARIRELRIFDENTYYSEVYLPLLERLGVERSEMRNRVPRPKSALTTS